MQSGCKVVVDINTTAQIQELQIFYKYYIIICHIYLINVLISFTHIHFCLLITILITIDTCHCARVANTFIE